MVPDQCMAARRIGKTELKLSLEDVVTTLIDLKTFLDHKNCVFIVAADREVLESALNQAPQAKPVRDNEPYYSTAGAFLDKIFQHQLTLPPMRPEALTNFAMSLVEKQAGLWSQLRQTARLYEDVVYSLFPPTYRVRAESRFSRITSRRMFGFSSLARWSGSLAPSRLPYLLAARPAWSRSARVSSCPVRGRDHRTHSVAC
jgi:hypothetical protein